MQSSEESFIGNSTFRSHVSQLSVAMKRKPLFYVATVLLPIFLLNTMSCLSILLPAKTGDRIAMLLSCLLAAVIYLETTFKYIPTSSTNFPLIIWLVMVTLLTTGLQIVLAGICLNWANKEERKKKPGKRFAFLMVSFMKLVLMLPYIVCKIKKCLVRKRKTSALQLQENQNQDEQDPQHDGNANELENALSDDIVMTQSYRSAIKMVDGLAIFIGIIILIVPVGFAYIAMSIPQQYMSKFCQMDIGKYIN